MISGGIGKEAQRLSVDAVRRRDGISQRCERELVELSGIEPLASSLRTRRSPS